MSDTDNAPPAFHGLLDDEDICPGCGKRIDASVISNSFLSVAGRRDQALVYGHGKFVHLHAVSIADFDALTVRASVKRWWKQVGLRARWYRTNPDLAVRRARHALARFVRSAAPR